jgi:hypothetical protein
LRRSDVAAAFLFAEEAKRRQERFTQVRPQQWRREL